MGYLEGDRWLDGPALVAWLERRLDSVPVVARPSSLTRRMYDWRRGSRADLYRLDAFLCDLGVHPVELPEELWAADQSHHGGNMGNGGRKGPRR